MDKIYSIGQFAEMIGKSVHTLQVWDRKGILKAYRSPSDRRYYTHSQYLEYMGVSGPTEKVNVIYARVSTRNQKDDLDNQIRFLQQYTFNQGIPVHEVLYDFGSGMNYKREKWNKLIDMCFDDRVSTIIISHKDRFVRFGFDWISDLLKRLTNTTILVVENVSTSPEEDLIQDLISIIHVFSCRAYGLRKYKRKLEKDLHEESL